MRADGPMLGNPWPHGMVISTDSRDQNLTDLLYVRALLDLTPTGIGVPPAAVVAVAPHPELRPASSLPSLESQWLELWELGLDWYREDIFRARALMQNKRGRPADERRSDDTSAQLELLHDLRRRCRTEFEDALFDRPAYRRWSDDMTAQDAVQPTLDVDPLRASLAEVIEAWHRGFTQLVTIPCTGTYTRSIGPHTLVVSERTLVQPAEFAAALRQFSPTDSDSTS